MASNRGEVTSRPTDREQALLQRKLPQQAAQISDAAPRRERAQMFGDASVKLEPEKVRRERSSPEPQNTAPTVGKTGGRGAKAEKPSEGSDRRQASAPPVEVTRTSKPPAETPKARSTTPPKTQKPSAAAG